MSKTHAAAHMSGILCIGLLALSGPSAAIDLVDKVLTVNVSSGLRTYDSDERAAITTSGSVTNIVKMGDGTLLSGDIGSYTGDFCVKDGIFAVTNSGLGSTSASTIVVEDGATVRFDITYSVTAKKYRITGAGHGGIGALCANQPFTLGNVELDGGTTISGALGTFKFSGNVDMNGHTLTQNLSNASATFQFGYSQLQDPGDIVVLNGYFAVGNDMLDGQGHTITLADKGRITRWGASSKCLWPVICDGPHPSSAYSRFYTGGSSTTRHFWYGPVTMTNGMTSAFATAHCDNRTSPTTFAFEGPISGDGNFSGSFNNNKAIGFLELNATNTYTGTTSAGYCAFLRAKFPEAVPDYSDEKFTVPSGYVAKTPNATDSNGRGSAFVMDGRCEENPAGWTGPQMVAMWEKYNNTDYPGDTCSANVFAGAREGENVVVTGAVFQSGIKYRIGAVGPGKVSLAAKFNNADLTVANIGTNALYVTAPWDGSAWQASPFSALSVGGKYYGGTLVFEDAGLVDFGSTHIYVGSWCVPDSWSLGGYEPGRLVVKGNTVLTHTCPLSTQTSTLTIGKGWGYDGIVEVCDGAIVTNRPDFATGTYSLGSLLIKGGTFYSTAGGNNDNRMGSRDSEDATTKETLGYVEVDRGALLLRGWFHIGSAAHARGLMYVKNGLVRSETIAINVGYSGTGVVYQTGGTVDAATSTAGEMFMVINSSTWKNAAAYRVGGRGIYTIDGPDAKTMTRTMYLSNRNDGDALLNLLGGGTLQVDEVLRSTAMIKGSGNWVVTNNPAYVYFDGGVLKARTANKELFGTGETRPTRIAVGPGGAIFDTDGKNVSISAPIAATGAGGVTSLTLTNGPLTHYNAAPAVAIVGDGTGATAVAEYDSATRRVTGVKVTSPGQGYTAANTVAYIDWCGYKTPKKVLLAVTIGNPTCGGIVKRGAGTLTLKAANTFTGNVAVEGGTLAVAADGALPAGSHVVAKGGIVQIASGVTGPSTIEIGIDPATLVRGQKYVLASYPAGAPATLPTIVWTGGEAPAHWEVQMRGTNLVLAFVRGITVNFR